MTAAGYIRRSLGHYRFAYIGVLAGAVLGAMVLLGALFAGDSVKESLRQIGEKRTGRATHLLAAGDRFFREALAEDLAAATGVRVAPLIYARGTAVHASTQATANQVQLIGVTDAFWQLAPEPQAIPLDAATSAIAVNDTLARRLGVAAGDTLIVRLQQPGVLGGNAPVAGAESTLQSLRCTIARVVGDDAFGRFNLEATQVPPASVFLHLALLQTALERPDRANLLLLDASAAEADPADKLRGVLQLADYELALRWLDRAGVFELTSDRVFIDPELADALLATLPGAQPVVSYLVNEFRVGERSTPYSIGAATTAEAAPFLPADLGPRELVINDWLAEDLQARAGDEVRLTFFQAGAAGALVEEHATFRVRGIVPLQGLAADRDWMPAFPGISDADTQSEWDPGLPLDLDRIRDKDEKYWDDYRGAPKAFLSLAGGRELWSSRWGSFTALRVPFARDQAAELAPRLLAALKPEMNQLLLRDFGAGAADAAAPAVDFGGLFVGMSFFLIVAALGLVAMLFQLVLLQRNREDALLGAVGLSERKILRWRLAEGVALLLVGFALGLPLAALYTRGILRFLETIWAGQGAGTTFLFSGQPVSIAAGGAGFLLCSLLAIWLAIRRQTRRALSIRLAAQAEEIAPPAKVRRFALRAGGLAALLGLTAIILSGRGLPTQAAFYLAGFAFLGAGLAACSWWLAREAPAASGAAEQDGQGSSLVALAPGTLGGLNLKARRSRSLTVVGLIATAVFMVLSVASFRKHVGADWLERGSGTGGFAYWVETTSVVNMTRDGRSEGFEGFERHAAELGAVVPLRAGVGDNVNCFNLNTTSQPRLLAVDASLLAAREAFRLELPADGNAAAGWNALRSLDADGALPALVDETTLLWALKRKVGDVLGYTDENGRAFNVRIVGTVTDSILQGHLLVDEALFLERFPSHPGYSVFLVDARDPAELDALAGRLSATLRDAGGRVDLTRDVLASFHQIENTYIAIFNVLGTLGVILGSLGLAVVVARNLRERRGEFAVMTAIGIPRGVLARMVFSEFGRLVLWGLAIGAVSSAIAVWPGLATLPAATTLLTVVALAAGIGVLNLIGGWLVFRWSTRDLRPGMA